MIVCLCDDSCSCVFQLLVRFRVVVFCFVLFCDLFCFSFVLFCVVLIRVVFQCVLLYVCSFV